MDNEAVALARGEFIMWNDSDDVLVPDALEKLITAWNSIPMPERGSYIGVTALCSDTEGAPLTKLPCQMPETMTWDTLATKYGATQDMVYFIRSDLLKAHRFPEVDFVVPESSVWCVLSDLRTRVVPHALLVKQYRAPGCISFSGLMQYSRGRAYAFAISKNCSTWPKRSSVDKLWRLITFIRYSLHGDISLPEASRLWTPVGSTAWFWAMVPIGALLAARDAAQGKVRKTHREFERARKVVKLSLCHNYDTAGGDIS
jgi:hypothetical protein